MSHGKLESTMRSQGQPDLSVLAAFVWEKPLCIGNFGGEIPILAMVIWAGQMIPFQKKECTYSQSLRAGETQLSGSQGQPGLLVMAIFVWEQSLDIGKFCRQNPVLAMGAWMRSAVLFHLKESPEPQYFKG